MDRILDSANGRRLNWRLMLALIVNLLLWIVILQTAGLLRWPAL